MSKKTWLKSGVAVVAPAPPAQSANTYGRMD